MHVPAGELPSNPPPRRDFPLPPQLPAASVPSESAGQGNHLLPATKPLLRTFPSTFRPNRQNKNKGRESGARWFPQPERGGARRPCCRSPGARLPAPRSPQVTPIYFLWDARDFPFSQWGSVEAEVFVKDSSLAARDASGRRESCSPGVRLRDSSLKRREFDFQQWVCFAAVEESGEKTRSLVVPPENIILGGKVSCVNCASPRKLPSQGASITLPVLAAPHQLASLRELPRGAATSVSDPG